MATKRIKTGGRQKGTPNKINSTVKELIMTALNEVGGQEWLVKQATENPVAFMTLLGKLLPHTLAGDRDKPVEFALIRRVIVNSRQPQGNEQ